MTAITPLGLKVVGCYSHLPCSNFEYSGKVSFRNSKVPGDRKCAENRSKPENGDNRQTHKTSLTQNTSSGLTGDEKDDNGIRSQLHPRNSGQYLKLSVLNKTHWLKASEARGLRNFCKPTTSSEARGSRNLCVPTTSSEARGWRDLDQPITSSEARGLTDLCRSTTSSEARCLRDVCQPIPSSGPRGLRNPGQPTVSNEARGLTDLDLSITSIEAKGLNESWSWSTYKLERSESQKRSWSIYNLERSERLNGYWST